MKTVETWEDSFAVEEKYEGQPHGWIQWKGTDVCMDFYCTCGFDGHIDASFCYKVQCPQCGKFYACNGHIEFIEVLERDVENAVIPGGYEDPEEDD